MDHTKSRMTRQRSVILEELQRIGFHPTAEELHERVRLRMPRISLGTVYRNLELLSEAGDIARLEVGGRRRYDGNVHDEHYHARCTQCGAVEDVPSSVVTRFDFQAEAVKGFRVTGHQLTFTGLCARCARKTRDRREP